MRKKRAEILRVVPLLATVVLAVGLIVLWALDHPVMSIEWAVALSSFLAVANFGIVGATVVLLLYALPKAALLFMAGASTTQWVMAVAVLTAIAAATVVVHTILMELARRWRVAMKKPLLLRRELNGLRRAMDSSVSIASVVGTTSEILDVSLSHLVKFPTAVGAAWVLHGDKEEHNHLLSWPSEITECLRELGPDKPKGHFYAPPLNVLAVYFRTEGVGSGALAVALRGPKRRYRSTLRALSYIAASVETSLAKGRSLDVQRTQTSHLKMLYEFGKRFAVSLSLEDLFDAMYAETNRVMDAGAFFVALYHPDRREVELRFLYDDGVRVPPTSFQLNEGPTSRAILTKAPVLHNREGRSIPGVNMYGNPERSVQSVLIVPILLQDEVIGAISAQSYQQNAFTEEHVQLLSIIASQAAIALDNAKLYESTLRLAMTDSMTGLSNSRALHGELVRHVAQADDRSTLLSLLIVDADGLKQINDRFGHMVGDEHIRHIGEAIRGSVRADDVVARYGGDEFVVLLPNTAADEAFAVAMRVLNAIRQKEHQVGLATIKGTASIGVATYPLDALNADGLLRAADAAMYRAKKAGKDRVVSVGDEGDCAVGE